LKIIPYFVKIATMDDYRNDAEL